MSRSLDTAMDGTDLTGYLASHWSGVLCVSAADGGHGIPVAFTYDQEDGDLYLRYAHDPENWEGPQLETGATVSLLSYDETDANFESVTARGRIEELSDGSIDEGVLQSLDDLEVPVADVLGEGADPEYMLARLDITNVSGRRSEWIPA